MRRWEHRYQVIDTARLSDKGTVNLMWKVDRYAPNCVKWGGATGGVAYNSPSEHC